MILYHNTSNENAIKIADEGIICGLRVDVYGKGSEAEGAGIWCTIQRGYGYGGATITFEIDDNDELLKKQNDTEYILYRNVEPNEIIDIDLVISSISSISGHTGTVESDIPNAIKKFGKDKILQVFKKNESKFVNPYNYDKLVNLIETGNKILKGAISLVENKKITEDINDYKSTIEEINKIVDTCKKYNIIKDLRKYTIPAMRNYQLQYNPTADSRKAPWIYLINEINSINGEMDSTLVDFIDDFIREGNQCIKDNTKTESKKLEEASRNELLAKAKAETITRYNKSAGYKGFSLVDIDTTAIKTRDSIIITNNVGKYFDSVELDDILYWVGLEVTEARDNKMTQKVVEKALLGAMDGMDIKVDCNCGDFCLEENTLIKLLNGNVVTVKQLKDMFDNKDELWLYSTDSNGDFRPGKVENVWVSGKSDKMVKVTLDNGREIITTPNHKYMMRDGSYKEAQYLSEYDSLMPLYFSYHNGYENVKLNSKKATQFHSVYKIVADTLLSKEKELAKERSGEDTIQIHHKDFNKLNNYPSNLEPKGKLEHWYYHASLAGKNIDKLIKAGRDFWENDPRRFEALEKQKEMASKCKKEWWASMTKGERHRWALENNWACQPENSKSISDNAKDIWRKYTENEKNHRLRTNPFIVNNPMKDEVFKNSDKFIQRNKDISNSLQRFHENTTQEQRSELYGWAKGKKFSDSHRSKISKALKEKSNETQRKGIITRCRKTINRIIENNLPINEENFEIYKGKYDPSYLRVFDNFNDMLNKLDIPTNYNHKVIGVELITYDNPIEVYDIEVKDYHNFYVDAGVMLHNCYRFAYMATQFEYKYGKPENRPSNITNPDGYGAMCKHLIALLSNKSWISQVASTLQQWIIDEIDWVRDFLKMSEEEFKLPDEYARYLGKHGAMKKFWDKQPDEEEQDTDTDEENEDSDSDIENDEATNDNPDTDDSEEDTKL